MGSSSESKAHETHILIIGAGITGLVLAQALRKHSIPFSIYERDPFVSYRGRGWGLTIHWSLNDFNSLLPQHLIDRLPSVYVNPEASNRGENGNFLFFDLRSGETKWKVPPAKRIRVSRERLRKLLLDGLDVQWSKKFSSMSFSENAVNAHFEDGSKVTGSLLIGADGIRSLVRPSLLSMSKQPPSISQNNMLPVRILGVSVTYPPPLASKLRAIDPFFYQGGDPGSDAFIFFSFLDTPSSYSLREGRQTDSYECQIILSWPYRSGWNGNDKPTEAPESTEERIQFMKNIAKDWAEPFKDMIMNLPEQGVDIKALKLEDWVPKPGLWSNHEGRVTLVGDAAHAMTMFRGEGANHGVADVAALMQRLLPQFSGSEQQSSLQGPIDAFESEMIQRTGPAVLTSRRACMDAHDFSRINDQSPLVSKRVMITTEE